MGTSARQSTVTVWKNQGKLLEVIRRFEAGCGSWPVDLIRAVHFVRFLLSRPEQGRDSGTLPDGD